MRNILRTILRRNLKNQQGRFYISRILFDLLNDFVTPVGVTKILIDDSEFIEISTIDKEVRARLGILDSQVERVFEVETGYSPDSRQKFAQLDIDYAIAQQVICENEFINSFCDPLEVKRKSLTLAILRVITPKKRDQEYLREVFRILQELKLDIELPLNGYKAFYLKLNWYNKIGFIKGCIDGVPGPNSKLANQER
jgi:hypothetical protein